MQLKTDCLQKKDCFFTTKLYAKSCAFGELGAYANEEIKKGEIVAIYTGKVIDKKAHDALSPEFKHYTFGIGNNAFLAPYSLEDLDEDDYINHSCEPNIGIVGLNILVAMKDIRKDEELTIDYAMCDTQEEDMVCLCGTKLCRKVITGNDWKLPQLQKKYKRFFSDYILRKIDALANEKQKESSKNSGISISFPQSQAYLSAEQLS